LIGLAKPPFYFNFNNKTAYLFIFLLNRFFITTPPAISKALTTPIMAKIPPLPELLSWLGETELLVGSC